MASPILPLTIAMIEPLMPPMTVLIVMLTAST